MMKRLSTIAALVMVPLWGPWLTGCLSEAELGTGAPFCVDPESPLAERIAEFRPVNNMLERRCGTLDCHGSFARPFIVFGQNALRRPGGEADAMDPNQYFSGGIEPTLDFEVEGTWLSACGLEPEEMDLVVKKEEGATPETLTLIRKPRLEEKHKGGRLWGAGTRNGDRCLVGWVTGELDPSACVAELEDP